MSDNSSFNITEKNNVYVSPSCLSGRSILYIEDDPINRLLVKKILSSYNVKVDEAEDGLKGLELGRNGNYDLILLDVNMEGMTGYEVAMRLRMLPECKCVPIVVLTANVLNKARDRAIISGCNGFITKPIERESFPQLISEYLCGRSDLVESSKVDEITAHNTTEIICHLENEIRGLKRANEELKEIDKIKSNFIALVSHELRTPLSPIVGYLSFLLGGKYGELSPQLEKILNIISRNAARLEKITYDMFTLDLLERNVNFMNKSEVQLVNLLHNEIEDHELIFEERKLWCNLVSDDNIPRVYCDEVKMSQVFCSIIDNAIKYTPDGNSIEVGVFYPSKSISHKFDLDPDDYVEVCIEDEGVGIPQDKLSVIFDKFVELSDIDTHHSSEVEFMGGGVGLGLSICKGIVRDHKGFIWAENREVAGSRFCVLLPLHHEDSLNGLF